MAKLRELMSKPLPCGPDGEYASEQLYSLIGDDSLFDDIGELADKDPDADCRELVMARAKELGVEIDVEESIEESPTQEEPASEYQQGQANAAAGKERSLEMGMGGQDVVKTAGGSDIEEGMDSFVNPNDQDATRSKTGVNMKNADAEDMTEDENFDVRIKLSPQQIENAENYELDLDDIDQNAYNAMNKDPMSIKNDIVGEIYGFLEDAVRNDAVPVDDVYYDFNDYRNEVILFGGDKVEKAFFGVRGIDDEDDVEAFIEACRIALADLGKIVKNDELQAMAEMADMRRLSGLAVTQEVQDIDTGKQALKAERDPMLERILNLAKG
jgi:hypothetical protein